MEHVDDYPEHLVFCLTESDVDYLFRLVEYYGERLDLGKLFEACNAGDLGEGSDQ